MVFQVFMNRRARSVRHPKLRVQVFYKKDVPPKLVGSRKSPAGYFKLSSPELTAYDVVAYPRSCPSLDHAATVFVELGEAIQEEALAELPQHGCKFSSLQRVGWLLDRAGWEEKTEPLRRVLQQHRLSWRLLDTRLSPGEGPRNQRWKII
jgi:hypothetical protein